MLKTDLESESIEYRASVVVSRHEAGVRKQLFPQRLSALDLVLNRLTSMLLKCFKSRIVRLLRVLYSSGCRLGVDGLNFRPSLLRNDGPLKGRPSELCLAEIAGLNVTAREKMDLSIE